MPQAKKDATETAEKPRRTRNNQKFIRNLYGSPATLTLQSKRRIELAPRGMRGDVAAITKEEQGDPTLLINIDLLVEVINHAAATEIIGKQNINQQVFHPALALIGQSEVRMDEPEADKGTVVAPLRDGNITIDRRGGGIERKSVGPNVSGDFPGSDAEMANIMGVDADDAARNGDNLEEVLSGFKVER